MIKPIANHEFCTIGAGYKLHIRAIGSRKAKCGSNGQRTQSSGVKVKDANRCIDNGSWILCVACTKHTTN